MLSIPNNTVTGKLGTYTITHVRFDIPESSESHDSFTYYNPSTIVNHSTDYIANLLYFPIIMLRTIVSAFTITSTYWDQGDIKISIYGYGDNSSTAPYYYKQQDMSSTVHFTSNNLDKRYYYIDESLYNPDYSNIDSSRWFKPQNILNQYDNIRVNIYYNGNNATFTHTALQIDVFILGCIYT